MMVYGLLSYEDFRVFIHPSGKAKWTKIKKAYSVRE